MTPPVDVLPDPDPLTPSAGQPAELAAASGAGVSATAVVAPLRVVVQEDRVALTRRQRMPALAWLLDGPGWPWLRAAADLTALLVAISAVATTDARAALLPLAPLAICLFWVRGKYRRRISAHLLRDTASAAGGL